MANPEQSSNEPAPPSLRRKHFGYVFGPTPPTIVRDSEGIVTGLPIVEAADIQNERTTKQEILLARHFRGLESLSPEQITEVSKEHRETADQPAPLLEKNTPTIE